MRKLRFACAMIVAVMLLSQTAWAAHGYVFDISDIKVNMGHKTVNLKPTFSAEIYFEDDYSLMWCTGAVSAGKKYLDDVTVAIGGDVIECTVYPYRQGVSIEDDGMLDSLIYTLAGEDMALSDALELMDIALLVGDQPIYEGVWQPAGDYSYHVSMDIASYPVSFDVTWGEADDLDAPYDGRSLEVAMCSTLDEAADIMREPLKPTLHGLLGDGSVCYLVKTIDELR